MTWCGKGLIEPYSIERVRPHFVPFLPSPRVNTGASREELGERMESSLVLRSKEPLSGSCQKSDPEVAVPASGTPILSLNRDMRCQTQCERKMAARQQERGTPYPDGTIHLEARFRALEGDRFYVLCTGNRSREAALPAGTSRSGSPTAARRQSCRVPEIPVYHSAQSSAGQTIRAGVALET
jgi:hypothetical protein